MLLSLKDKAKDTMCRSGEQKRVEMMLT
jgi:hypothetical protein